MRVQREHSELGRAGHTVIKRVSLNSHNHPSGSWESLRWEEAGMQGWLQVPGRQIVERVLALSLPPACPQLAPRHLMVHRAQQQ